MSSLTRQPQIPSSKIRLLRACPAIPIPHGLNFKPFSITSCKFFSNPLEILQFLNQLNVEELSICTATMSFNGAVDEAYPTPDAAEQSTVSHLQKGFKISARKLPISKSGPIDEMSKKLGIPVPEMIFGDNMVSIEHVSSGWRLEFNALEALDRVDKTDKNMLKVAYSKEWSSSRYE